MVRSLPKSGAADAKGLKNSKSEKQGEALPQLKRPLRTQRSATQKISAKKQVSSNTEPSEDEIPKPKSRLGGAQNSLTSYTRKVTRGNKKLNSPTVLPDNHQDDHKLSAMALSATSVPTKVTRHRSKGTLKSNISDELSDPIPDGTSTKNTKNAPKKKSKAGTNDSVGSEYSISSKKSQMITVPVSAQNGVSTAKEQSSKTNVLQKPSETPTRAPVLRRTRREKLPFDSDPAPVQEMRRSKPTPKSDGNQSNSVSKKKLSVNKTSILLKKKVDATKCPVIPSLKKKGRASKNPVLSTSTDEKMPQNIKSDCSVKLTRSAATSNVSVEKLPSSKKLKTNHLKSAIPKPLTQSNFNTLNENVNSSVHPETLLTNSVNLSFDVTKSPVIRTRKVNPKYADCVIPSQFSFVKQALTKTVTTPSSHHRSNNLAVSTPVPLVFVKDVTGLDKNNLDNAEEGSPTDTTELPISEVPDIGSNSENRNILVNMDLNSDTSKNTEGSQSLTRSQKSTIKTQKKKSEPQVNLASAVSSQKIVKCKNNVKIDAKTKDSVTNEGTAPKPTSSSRLTNKLSKAANKTTKNSATIESTPNCVVKLSEFPIKLAVFRSPSHNAPANTTANPGQFCEDSAQQQALALSSAATPRLSKRELLARALREGKLGKVTSARAIKKSDVKLNVPVLVKSTENATKKDASVVHANTSALDSSEMVRDKKTNLAINKKPVWAHAISPKKKVKRLSSTRTKLPASNKSQAVFEFSFNSEDDKAQRKVQNVRKIARVTKPKIKIIKEKLQSTKTKILTTDPNFEKEFPTTWDCRHGKSRKPVATTCNQLLLDESFHDDFDMHDDDFDDLEPDIRPSSPVKVLSNSNPEETRGLPNDNSEIISSYGVPGVQIKDKSHPHNVNTQLNSLQSGQNSISSENGNEDPEYLSRTPLHNERDIVNAGKASSSGNMALPTPDATRLMSKLVGGTSTPFSAPNGCPVGSYNGPSIPIALTSSRAETQPEPITVSEQIKACFGFDESDEEVDANNGCEFTSLNLSPVHHENGSFHPHQYSVLSEAGNGSVRGLVSRNNSCQSNTSQGAFLRPTLASAATSRVLARAAPNSRISQDGSVNQRNFRILTKTVPIPGKSLLVPKPSNHSSKPSVKILSQSNNPTVHSKDTQSSTVCPVVSTAEERGISITSAVSVHVAEKDSAAKQKDIEQSYSVTYREKNNTVDSNVATGSPVRANGAVEESRLFDDIDISPAKTNTPSKSPQSGIHSAAATDSPIVSPEKSFSEPVRHAYDRRSVELSRRALLQTLAGGAPDQDDEAEMADQEDVSSVGAPRRRKRRGATAASRGRGRPAKQPTIVESFSAVATKLGAKNEGNEENRGQSKKSVMKTDAETKPPVRTKRLRRDDVEGNNNKKAKSQQPPQPESILVTDHRTSKAAKSVVFDDSSEQSSINSSNASSSSGQAKKPKYSKKPTKAAAFEKSMNDWASDINSHFSEVEDLELVVM